MVTKLQQILTMDVLPDTALTPGLVYGVVLGAFILIMICRG